MYNGAKQYTQANIRTVIKNPINFANFTTSLTDIQRAAQLSGIYLNDAGVDAWRLVFNGNGTITVSSCTKSGSNAIEDVMPNCSLYSPAGCTVGVCNVPSNGAIYAQQSVVIGWNFHLRQPGDHRQLRQRPRHGRVEQRHRRRDQSRLHHHG